MIHIMRREKPDFWKQYQRKHPGTRYDDLDKTEEGKQFRKRIREFNIEQQHGLCAYCCKRISIDDSLNEHIKPRGKYDGLSMEYSNIIACCRSDGQEGTCSASKKDQYDVQRFVSPLDPDCETHFKFYRTGEIVSNTTQGTYTIDLLNLNSYRLCKARRAQLKVCENYHDDKLVRELFLQPDDQNRYNQFIDIVRFFFSGADDVLDD